MFKDRLQVRNFAFRNLMDGIKRQRHCPGYRQVQTNKPLQACGPPTMGIGRNRRVGCYERGMRIILHCSTFWFACSISACALRARAFWARNGRAPRDLPFDTGQIGDTGTDRPDLAEQVQAVAA